MNEIPPQKILVDIFQAGLSAVTPEGAAGRFLRLDKESATLYIDDRPYALRDRRVRLVGAGKGAAPMALAIENLLGDLLNEGLIVVKYDHDLPLKKIRQRQAAHPVPDVAGDEAAREVFDFVRASRPDDLLLCVFTGGASALLPASIIGLDELAEVTRLLLESGAPIEEINAVRRHFSRLGGGKLARGANGAEIVSLIISDVIGDRLEAIASGPTTGDPASWGDARAILEKRQIWERLPKGAREAILLGEARELPDNPKPGDALFERVHNILCASNRQALDAAAAKAEELGFETEIVGDDLSGEAREVARELCALALARQGELSRPLCLLGGGETTVTVRGKGLGGRNQEMALAANIALMGKSGIYALFAGTDGTDGPTDDAGGFAMPDGVAKMGGLAACEKHLAANDSNPILKKGALLFNTGPTRTNVMDLAIILARPVI